MTISTSDRLVYTIQDMFVRDNKSTSRAEEKLNTETKIIGAEEFLPIIDNVVDLV